MAIYKPTYCEPFLSTEDFSTINATNPLYLYCKIASSNLDVTGYSIRLLGPNNEQQFPPASPPETSLSLDSISFIEDLKLLPLNPDPSNPDTNSGRNGTFLKIPFYVGDGSKASNTVSRNQINNNTLTLYNGNDYKWIITLYQLEKVTGGSGDNRYRIPTNVNYYDIILTTGVIVGSAPKRIQTMPSDKILSDYYIQPVQINDVTANGNLVSQRATSWTHTGDITPVGSRGRIYTYDNMLGHLYPQLAVEGAWENVINRTLWLAGIDGVANGIQVFKQSGNWDDLQTTQKVDMMPFQKCVPWTWKNTPANQSQSYGEQVYWTSATNADENKGYAYPFNTQANVALVSSTANSQIADMDGEWTNFEYQKPVCIDQAHWWVIVPVDVSNNSVNKLFYTSDGGITFTQILLHYDYYEGGLSHTSVLTPVSIFKTKDSYNASTNQSIVNQPCVFILGQGLINSSTQGTVLFKCINPTDSSPTITVATNNESSTELVWARTADIFGPTAIYNYGESDMPGWTYWIGYSTVHSSAEHTSNFYVWNVCNDGGKSFSYSADDINHQYDGDDYHLFQGFVSAPFSRRFLQNDTQIHSITTMWATPSADNRKAVARAFGVYGSGVLYASTKGYQTSVGAKQWPLIMNGVSYLGEPFSYGYNPTYNTSTGTTIYDDNSVDKIVWSRHSGQNTYFSFRYWLDNNHYYTSVEWGGFWNFLSLSSVLVQQSLNNSWVCIRSTAGGGTPQISLSDKISNLGIALGYPSYDILNSTQYPVVYFGVYNSGSSADFYMAQQGSETPSTSADIPVDGPYQLTNDVFYLSTHAYSGFDKISLPNNRGSLFVAFGPRDTIHETGTNWVSASFATDAFSPALPEDSAYWGPQVAEGQRIVLNYQSPDNNYDFTDNLSPAPSEEDSPFNGIYTPYITTEYYDLNMNPTSQDSQKYYAKITIRWIRAVDADTWGELLQKIVMVNPDNQDSGNWAGQNIQINVESENNNGGVLNTTPFKFVAEKPIKLYELDETNNPDINKTAIIFYNNPTDTGKEIIPANTLFVKPLNNLENGNIIRFTGRDAWGELSDVDDSVWSVKIGLHGGVMVVYSFNVNDAVFNPQSNPRYLYADSFDNGSIALQDAQLDGYTFNGWYNNNTPITDLGLANYENAVSSGVINLVGSFTILPSSFSITYDGMDGAENDPRNPNTFSTTPVALYAPTKEGYSFNGWYLNNVLIEEIPLGTNQNVTVVAHWEAISYIMNYHPGMGTEPSPSVFSVGSSITLPNKNPTGHSYFVGWYLRNNFLPSEFLGEGNSVLEITQSKVNEWIDRGLINNNEITVYGKWESTDTPN